jgi:uncharacterized protein YdeI (YjbR/CyaY-like superfamily)
METNNGIPAFHAATTGDWRNWLEKNSETEKSVCLIVYHKKSKTPSIDYNEAMEEALCFGWVDGKANKRDAESSYLFFTKRSPKSNWSGINKERVAKMVSKGLMTPSGQATIDLAKKTGTWDALVDVEKQIIPADMQALFDKNEPAFKNFQAFAPSARRMILTWILSAKKPETRQQRVEKTVELAANNIKSKI